MDKRKSDKIHEIYEYFNTINKDQLPFHKEAGNFNIERTANLYKCYPATENIYVRIGLNIVILTILLIVIFQYKIIFYSFVPIIAYLIYDLSYDLYCYVCI